MRDRQNTATSTDTSGSGTSVMLHATTPWRARAARAPSRRHAPRNAQSTGRFQQLKRRASGGEGAGTGTSRTHRRAGDQVERVHLVLLAEGRREARLPATEVRDAQPLGLPCGATAGGRNKPACVLSPQPIQPSSFPRNRPRAQARPLAGPAPPYAGGGRRRAPRSHLIAMSSGCLGHDFVWLWNPSW